MLKFVHTQNTITLRRANNTERVWANLNVIGVSENIHNYSDSLYLNCVHNSLNTVCWNPVIVTLTNSGDPGEIPQNVAFPQGLHCPAPLFAKIKIIKE